MPNFRANYSTFLRKTSELRKEAAFPSIWPILGKIVIRSGNPFLVVTRAGTGACHYIDVFTQYEIALKETLLRKHQKEFE